MKIDPKLQNWITAKSRHRLSQAHVQTARKLGMNPLKLGKIDNHKQEPWKLPLREFIEELYFKRFGKDRPDVVLSFEELARRQEEKKTRQKDAKLNGILV